MQVWTFVDGKWVEGNPMLMGPMTHGAWLASTVFDGARAFEGVTPDLDRHCERMVNSVAAMGLKALHSSGELVEIATEGVAKFPKETAVYIRPMYWAEGGFVDNDPETTRFCLCVYEAPMPDPSGFSVTLSPFRRPGPEMAPTLAKAACHYPNSGRALRDVGQRGFGNAVMLDPLGHVAELATANIFMVRDGEAHTPAPNGTFLNGITRQRVIDLLTRVGVKVHARTLTYGELQEADELFSTGNWGKVLPITRIEGRDLQPGPVYSRARELYWAWSHGEKV